MRSPLAVSIAVTLLLTGCTPAAPDTAAPDTAAPDTAAPNTAAPNTAGPDAAKACVSPVETGPLPEWARAGFSGDASMPHTMGDRGEIVAAIFGNPLTASRSDGMSNKILWVSKVPAPTGDLVIEARLTGNGNAENRRVAGGPGPSIIDLPSPGCWHLTLTWPEHTDTMALVYK